MNVAEVITEPMSVMDGARAAAVMVADQRLTPQIPDIGGDCDPGREWGDPDFTLEDASIAAFLGDGCEPFSRHQQMLGAEWNDDHMGAFTHGFITMARACLWPGGGRIYPLFHLSEWFQRPGRKSAQPHPLYRTSQEKRGFRQRRQGRICALLRSETSAQLITRPRETGAFLLRHFMGCYPISTQANSIVSLSQTGGLDGADRAVIVAVSDGQNPCDAKRIRPAHPQIQHFERPRTNAD